MLRAIGFLAVTSLIAGCTDSSSTLATVVVPTLLTIDPLKFRGAVPCGAPGLQTYVVALSDVGNPYKGFVTPGLVAVSVPTACPMPTSFGSSPVVANDFYIAAIDGYDRADITPSAPGSRQMRDGDGNVVPPRWQTHCGTPPTVPDASTVAADASDAEAAAPAAVDTSLFAATQAILTTEVFMQGCLPLQLTPLPDASTGDAGPIEADAGPDADLAPDTGAGDTSSPAPDAAIALPDAGIGAPPDASLNGG